MKTLHEYINQMEDTGNITTPATIAAAGVAFCFVLSEILRIIL